MQRFPGDLQRVSNEPVEFDLGDVRSCLSAHEVQIFALAFSAVTKTQGGTALKHHVAKHAYIRQGRQQMKMNRLLDKALLHLARVPASIRPVFRPTRRRSRADRSTVASSTPSSLMCTSVPSATWRSVWVNSIAPQGVSKRPGEPVVMHVKVVAS